MLSFFGVWQGNTVEDTPDKLTENIKIIKTPGHDYTSLSLVVKTEQGIVAICGDVFWKENYPEIDPYAQNQHRLNYSRESILLLADFVIPGHGPMFTVKDRDLNKKSEDFSPQIKKTELKEEVREKCSVCKRSFIKNEDKCPCQEWLCFRCCECGDDCWLCSCKHKKKNGK